MQLQRLSNLQNINKKKLFKFLFTEVRDLQSGDIGNSPQQNGNIVRPPAPDENPIESPPDVSGGKLLDLKIFQIFEVYFRKGRNKFFNCFVQKNNFHTTFDKHSYTFNFFQVLLALTENLL